MSSASKCDRCGKYYDAIELNSSKVNFLLYGALLPKGYEKDLCPECTDKFMEFMKGDESDDKR